MDLFREGLKKQAVLSLIYKFSSILLSYLTVPVLIGILGNEKYGVWVALSSLFGWISVLDMGIGSGLQNELVKSVADSDFKLSKCLISTSYISTSIIAFIIVIFGLIAIKLMPVSIILDTAALRENEPQKIMLIMLGSTGIILILKLYINIQNALKKSSTGILTGLISNILYIFSLLLISRISGLQITIIAVVKNISVIAVFFIMTIAMFTVQRQLRPGVKYFNRNLIINLSGISLQFFIIQLCWNIINSTDNIIISSQLGSLEVTVFSLVFRIVTIGKLVFFLILTPFWPQFSEYHHMNDYKQMKRLLMNYGKIMFFIDSGMIAISFFIPIIIKIWTGQSMIIPTPLVIFSVLFVVLDNVVGLFSYCLNAINRIKLQMYLYIFGAVINIPLSIKLVNTLLGSSGAILASCICYLPLVILMPWQVIIEMKKVKKNGT